MVGETAVVALGAITVREVEAEVVLFEMDHVALREARVVVGVAPGLDLFLCHDHFVFDVAVEPKVIYVL